VHLVAVPADDAGGEVDLEPVETHYRLVGALAGAPEGGLQARHQLAGRERLPHPIISRRDPGRGWAMNECPLAVEHAKFMLVVTRTATASACPWATLPAPVEVGKSPRAGR
jgi:hypothetical protein